MERAVALFRSLSGKTKLKPKKSLKLEASDSIYDN